MGLKTASLLTSKTVTGTTTEFGNFVALGDFAQGNGQLATAHVDKLLFSLLVSGTVTGTVDVTLQGSFTGASTDAFDIRATEGPSGTVAKFTKTATGNDAMVVCGPLPPYVRAKIVTAAAATGTLDSKLAAIGVNSF